MSLMIRCCAKSFARRLLGFIAASSLFICWPFGCLLSGVQWVRRHLALHYQRTRNSRNKVTATKLSLLSRGHVN